MLGWGRLASGDRVAAQIEAPFFFLSLSVCGRKQMRSIRDEESHDWTREEEETNEIETYSFSAHGRMRQHPDDWNPTPLLNPCEPPQVILGDEMGLGKTLQTVGLLQTLLGSWHSPGPCLVVVSLPLAPPPRTPPPQFYFVEG